MSQNNFSSEDPKLTAYALGELEGDERAAVEAALRDNPAARALVDEIRGIATQLTTALAAEPAPIAKPTQLPAYREKKLITFPQFYYIAGLAAAACFAVIVALRPPVPHPAPEKVVRTEVNLPKDPGTPEEKLADEATVAPAVVVAPVEITELKPPVDRPASSLLDEIKKERIASEEKNPPTTLSSTFSVAPSETPAGSALPPAIPPATRDRVTRIPPSSDAVNPTYAGVSTLQVAQAGNTAAPPATISPGGSALADSGGEVVVLSPFKVSSSPDYGYAASSTLSGSRISNRDRRAQLPSPPHGARFGENTESYAYTPDNDFLGVLQNPLSTFSIDADTAGYANVRRFLQNRSRPPRDAVRIEELLNYFSYDYVPPKDDKPFAAALEVASAPWAPTHRLVRIGLKGREVSTRNRPAANLVFLLDVSGSMNAPNRLPLVKESMRMLVGKLRADDRVAIVVYAGASGLALPSTPVSKAGEILAALDALEPGGSTNGAMGIQLAYDIAKANFVNEGLNRVILCTDGDFNVGATSGGDLTRLIEEKAKSGVFLTVLGFGMGNLKDDTLETLADRGNGNYGYIDTRAEAEKLLVEQVNGTLMTIAKDVKIQVEFNPAKVASYRLIGYENRLLKKEDFNNDKVDAGEIGAGHTVTALYEIVPVGAEENRGDVSPAVDELKYSRTDVASSRLTFMKGKTEPVSDELLTVKIRYKKPDGLISHRLEFPLSDRGTSFADASGDFKFAAAVAGFGMLLRESPHKGSVTLGEILAWAEKGRGDDADGYRRDFIGLINTARALLN